jgi:hypothetical protein
MANAKLSPKELADLLDKLDEAQQKVESARDQLIRAMAARRRPRAEIQRNIRARRTKQAH